MAQSDFVTRGQALVSSGQYQEAVKVCRLGLLGRPTTVEGRVVLGQALLALRRYDEVLAEMQVAIELDHASSAAHALKGEALLRKGDAAAALDVLRKLRDDGRADDRVFELIAEAEPLVRRSASAAAAAPAAQEMAPEQEISVDQEISEDQDIEQEIDAFAEQGTRNYPAHQVELDSIEETVGEYTRPTSLAATSARRRPTSVPMATPPNAMPSPPSPGDRSGTVEVDPELERAAPREPDEDDFGDIAAPPIARDAGVRSPAGRLFDAARGSVATSPRSPRMSAAQPVRRSPIEVSTVELGDDEVFEIEDPRVFPEPQSRPARRGTGAVRAAIRLPSGPLDAPRDPPFDRSLDRQAGPGAARSNGLPAQQPSAQLAQRFAGPPNAMNVMPTGSPQPMPAASPPPEINPRSAIAAALPTAAALPFPQPMQIGGMQGAMPGTMMSGGPAMMQGGGINPALAPTMMPGTAMAPMGQGPGMAPGPAMQGGGGMQPPHLQRTVLASEPVSPRAAMAGGRPNSALNAQQQESAAVIDALFTGQEGAGWSSGMPQEGPDDSVRQVMTDPQAAAAAVRAGGGQPSGGASAVGFGGDRGSSAVKPGRKARSRLQVLVWILIGAAVISGGVFAGFQIRALRLRRQIAAARDRAGDLARADTWQGWIGARDGLFSIAQASPTPDNKAALARARGVLAFEFGDNLPAARVAIDGLAGQSGLDVELAAAYIALTVRDGKASHDLAERAVREAPDDPAARYVSGQAALLGGDFKEAVAAMRSAVEHEPRPLYLVGLARALGGSSAWDEALATLDKVRDNPGAVIARGVLLADAGRVTGAAGSEARAQLIKLISDGQKSGDQGVSPSQVAFAYLALARVEFARGEAGAARNDYLASLGIGLDDQRYAEELGDTVYSIGELEAARKIVTRAVDRWPASRRARTTLAQILLATGKPAAALDVFTKAPDAAAWPGGQTVRGLARVQLGEIDGARGDFEAALKKLPGFEPAVIARTWLDLAAGELESARKRIEPKFNIRTATPGMVTIYAAYLRSTGEPDKRDKAKAMLERVAALPGPDAMRAQLELARVDRELGDFGGARAAYAEAGRAGSYEARLESGGLLIDIGDPRGGHAALEQLLKDVGERAAAPLLLEAARARTLIGDHAGAFALLAAAETAPGVVRWQLERERGRLALRKGDTVGAALTLARALDNCGSDLDTFLLAADTVSYDDKQTALLQKLRTLMQDRFKRKPEVGVIEGKLHLANDEFDEAEKAYSAAHQALEKAKAPARRLAQCDFGRAAVAYFQRDDAKATSMFKLVLYEDPSIDEAYLFAAELERARDVEHALVTARSAVTYNPASVAGWTLIGTIAAQIPRQRKQLDEAIAQLNKLAPGSEALRQLQQRQRGGR